MNAESCSVISRKWYRKSHTQRFLASGKGLKCCLNPWHAFRKADRGQKPLVGDHPEGKGNPAAMAHAPSVWADLPYWYKRHKILVCNELGAWRFPNRIKEVPYWVRGEYTIGCPRTQPSTNRTDAVGIKDAFVSQ